MKNIMLIIVLLIVNHMLISQKHDNIWMIGNHNRAALDKPMIIDFNNSKPMIKEFSKLPSFDFYCSTMSDSMGELLFFSNGLHIYNKNHRIMINGYGINPGEKWDYDFKNEGNYGSRFVGKSVSFPNHPKEYLHFHIGLERAQNNNPGGYAPFYVSRVDMDSNDGVGVCVERNVVLADKDERYTYFDMTKHANGRDWWIIILNAQKKEYYRFLISPDGIEKEKFDLERDFGPQNGSWLGFSPDGLKMILYESTEHFSILDFDRCTGELSNQKIISLPSVPFGSFFNLSFSSNSQYLYIGNGNEIYQVDLYEEDLEKSVFCITESDGYIETFSTSYIWSQLGPDDKIYITSGSSNKVLHVINRPNLPGLACDVQQHGIELPSRNFLGIPRFPNYRLGALEGSECDTLQGVVPKVEIIDSTNGDFKFAGKWYKRAFKE